MMQGPKEIAAVTQPSRWTCCVILDANLAQLVADLTSYNAHLCLESLGGSDLLFFMRLFDANEVDEGLQLRGEGEVALTTDLGPSLLSAATATLFGLPGGGLR